LVQRADRRSMSLDASGPQRMMNGTNAAGRAMQASLADDSTPRRAAAQLLKRRDWCVGSHAGEDDAIRVGGTAARFGG
jgi:hypothetical protein